MSKQRPGSKLITISIGFLILFLLSSHALLALDPGKKITQYSVKSWSMESGLPGNAVFTILQTQDGYLYSGTQEGTVRFDGVDFELFDQKDHAELSDAEIRALYEDRNGTLWIGTNASGLFRYKDGEFSHYPAAKHKALIKIYSIDEDRWGNLWIGSYTAGLTRLSNGTFTTYTTKNGLPDNEVNDIVKDKKGNLRVVTKTGIIEIDEQAEFHVCIDQQELLTTCFYKVETRELWVGTGDKYLFRLKNGKKKDFGKDAGLSRWVINCLYEDRMENLWIGMDGGGLARMTDGKISTFHPDDKLASAHVYSIYEDREGSLWVGTFDCGLFQLRDNKFSTFTVKEDMAADRIHHVIEARDGSLLIGTDGGLNRLSIGELTTVLTTEKGLLHNSVYSLCEDRGGRLWVGTQGGLHVLKDGKMPAYTTKDGLTGNTITYLLEDNRGDIWVGTKKGLNRFDRKSGIFKSFTTREGLTSNDITFIFEDSRGVLLIGTGAGLSCFNEGKLAPYPPVTGFIKVKFRCAYEDKEGTLWLGSDNGIICVRGKKAIRCSKKNGLIENHVHTILEDNSGYLWLGGRNGTARIRKKELGNFANGLIDTVHPDSYNEKDGMGSRFCTNVGCRTRDGRLWFPTTMGVAVIDPGYIRRNEVPPRVMIKEFVADGEPVDYFDGRDKGNKPVKLAPGKKRIEINYAGLSFIEPGEIEFKIKLDGYDRDWVPRGPRRSIAYTGLSPGLYTFYVMARNADGEWSKESASLSFHLLPYFYQTTWFVGLSVLFGLLAIFLLYRLRIRQLRIREKKLGELVELRTKDLLERNVELEHARRNISHSKELIEAKNKQLEEQSEKLKEMDQVKSRFFANISHEFRTPLTLIMGPLEQMLSDSGDEKQQKKLNLMLRNAQRLLGLINQLLELSKFDSGKAKLRAGRHNMIPFLKGIVANFEPLADQNEVALEFRAAEEDIPLYIDAAKFEDAITNLLINAVKFTPAGGEIVAAVNRVESSVEISVRDSGAGIPNEQLAHIFDRFYQVNGIYEQRGKGSGIGLALVKEIVQLHHGKIDVFSREGKGTEFRITLPSGDAHLTPDEILDNGASDIDRDGSPLEIDKKFFGGSRGAVLQKSPPGRRRQEEDIILIVEDSEDMREYIRGALASLYSVAEAVDGEEGLQKAREMIPDLIISDIMMPGIDGYELCRTLKKDLKTSHIPTILLTARASEENIVHGLETGADDYITKPFSAKILAARVKNLIELRRQLQSTINRELVSQPAAMPVSTIDKEFLKELKAAINKNISDPDFNVESLAGDLHMDRSTIYRKVLALTGESPTDFIRSCRLVRGAELLKRDFGTVLEVALEVGFSSANYFTKCFKKKFNRLPSTIQASEAPGAAAK